MPPPISDAQVQAVLTQGLEVLSRSEWTQGTQGRCAQGTPVRPEDPHATAVDVVGALRRAALRLIEDHALALTTVEHAARHLATALVVQGTPLKVYKASALRTLVEWNDAPGRARAEVLSLYTSTLLGLGWPLPRSPGVSGPRARATPARAGR
jgi:hypothetical protein